MTALAPMQKPRAARAPRPAFQPHKSGAPFVAVHIAELEEAGLNPRMRGCFRGDELVALYSHAHCCEWRRRDDEDAEQFAARVVNELVTLMT